MLASIRRLSGRALLGLLCLLSASCQPPRGGESAPDDLGPVGEFSLTERDGRTVTDKDLLGKVWVASFQFTRCTGQCPQISLTMRELQTRLAGRPDVVLVTFTVDPKRDTLKDLRKYAEAYGADPQRWLFLTGDEAEVYRLLRAGFHLHARQKEGKELEPGEEAIEHSPKVVVVDKSGHIRGYYDGMRDPNWPDPEEKYNSDLRQVVHKVDELRQPWVLPQPWFLPRDVPRFNALLNALSAVLIVVGYRAVRGRLIRLHVACMLSALVVSALFLASYLYFHLVVKAGQATRFADQAVGAPAWVGYLYYAVLGTHTVLAVFAAPLALVTAYLGLRGRLQRHVRVAWWTLPVWLYVSVTGVVVYVMLYRLYPSP